MRGSVDVTLLRRADPVTPHPQPRFFLSCSQAPHRSAPGRRPQPSRCFAPSRLHAEYFSDTPVLLAACVGDGVAQFGFVGSLGGGSVGNGQKRVPFADAVRCGGLGGHLGQVAGDHWLRVPVVIPGADVVAEPVGELLPGGSVADGA